MTVYLAITKQHLQKISDFLEAQPADSLVMRCWGTLRHKTVEWLEFFRSQKPFLDIYIVEDEERNIRVVWCWERRGFDPKIQNEPKIVTGTFFCMKHEDFASHNYTYIKELARHVVPKCLAEGISGAEMWCLERHLEWLQKTWRGAPKIRRQQNVEEKNGWPAIGNVYLIFLDFNAIKLSVK